MNVEPEVMAGSVRKLLLVALGFDVVVRRAVNLAKRGTRLHFFESSLLSLQHDLIDLTLPWCELSAHGVGSGDVAGIAAVFGSDINHHQLTRFHLPRARVVVKRRGVRSRADYRRKRRALRSRPTEFILEHGLYLILPHSRSDGFRGSFLPGHSDVDCLFDQGDFG